MECVALVMAAGSGLRLGRERPKQYQALAGLPMLRRTIDALRACPELRELQVVIGAGQDDLYDAATRGLELPPPVIGGATRQASVRRGLEALARRAPTHVLVHDAARP
ncbi:MAG: 2-C-methyl-D-erythritol 4-phosphate cytidylyltransferase, partial [Geminicoccaceae bacterium]|nr:2-C-methyl-D-erythritol 4-phosphate cytidylyltransferase [Geminicoccaceae bacterium]